MFRVIIAGGRDFDDYAKLSEAMDFYLGKIDDEIVVLCGMCTGADNLGFRYAKEHGYQVKFHSAEWDRFGRAAGPIRNEEMAKNADALVAFWDGQSRGTKNMIELAKKYKLLVRVKRYEKTLFNSASHSNRASV